MKATTKSQLTFAALPRDYAGLCAVLLPRPVRDRVDYANVSEVTDAMAVHEGAFTADQEDYFELLCQLLEEYDAQHTRWPARTPLASLKHLLAEQEMESPGLAKLLGVVPRTAAAILTGERSLTVEQIRKLAGHFAVSPALFIG